MAIWFLANLSTSHAILDIVTNAYDQIKANQYTYFAMLDYKKAFDTVCHKILLKLRTLQYQKCIT